MIKLFLHYQMFFQRMKESKCNSVIKKFNRHSINNYQPVPLLPISAKVFEKVIFNSLFKYSDCINLLNNNQPGFRPCGSSVHQLL